MGMKLQYPARCETCGGVMHPGTEAAFYIGQDSKRRFMHEGECPKPDIAIDKRDRRPDFDSLFDARQCSANCSTEWAFRKGHCPPRCHLCGAEWQADAEAEAGEFPPSAGEFAIPEFERP